MTSENHRVDHPAACIRCGRQMDDAATPRRCPHCGHDAEPSAEETGQTDAQRQRFLLATRHAKGHF